MIILLRFFSGVWRLPLVFYLRIQLKCFHMELTVLDISYRDIPGTQNRLRVGLRDLCPPRGDLQVEGVDISLKTSTARHMALSILIAPFRAFTRSSRNHYCKTTNERALQPKIQIRTITTETIMNIPPSPNIAAMEWATTERPVHRYGLRKQLLSIQIIDC